MKKLISKLYSALLALTMCLGAMMPQQIIAHAKLLLNGGFELGQSPGTFSQSSGRSCRWLALFSLCLTTLAFTSTAFAQNVIFDASTLALTSGNVVTSWGGQASAGTPTYLTGQTPNGRPAIQFNSGGDHMGNNVSLPASAAGDWILVAVIKPQNIGAYHNLADDDPQVRPMLWIDNTFRYELNFTGGSGALLAGTGPNGWDIVIADSRFNQLYVNSPTPNATGGGAVPYPATKFYDYFHRDGTQTFQGLVAEMRIYNNRTGFGGDFAALYNEMLAKWIQPIQAPVVVCPANIVVSNAPGQCSANVSFAATETVGIPASTISYSPASGSLFALGIATVTATATNAVGSSSCTFTVTVIDNQAPTIVCAPDVTINTTTGLCTGTTTLTPPTVSDNCTGIGNALDFDGVNDYVNVPNSASLLSYGTTDEITIEYWVNPGNSISNVIEALAAKRPAPNTAGWVIDKTNATGTHDHWLNFISGWVRVTVNYNINTWNHVAFTYKDGFGMRVYLNGTLAGSNTVNGNLVTDNSPLQIGGETLYGDYKYDGRIDEFRVWNVARTQAQIQANMNYELNAQAGLVAAYHFNQGVAGGNNAGITTAIDASGNGNNGTLNNFALLGVTSNWVGGTVSSAPTVTNNAPATYPIGNTTVTWTATDAAGLTATCTQSVTVINPIVVTSMKSDAAISGAVGTAGITTIPSNCTLLWSPGGQTTNYITNQTPGTYTVTATDANGCATSKAILIN